jgi:hypothetical protein
LFQPNLSNPVDDSLLEVEHPQGPVTQSVQPTAPLKIRIPTLASLRAQDNSHTEDAPSTQDATIFDDFSWPPDPITPDWFSSPTKEGLESPGALGIVRDYDYGVQTPQRPRSYTFAHRARSVALVSSSPIQEISRETWKPRPLAQGAKAKPLRQVQGKKHTKSASHCFTKSQKRSRLRSPSIESLSEGETNTPSPPKKKQKRKREAIVSDTENQDTPQVKGKRGRGRPIKAPVSSGTFYLVVRGKPKKMTQKGRTSKLVQPEPQLAGPFDVEFRNGWQGFLRAAADELGIKLKDVPVSSLSWSIVAANRDISKAIKGLPLKTEAGYREMVKQIQAHKRAESLIVAVTLPEPKLSKEKDYSWLKGEESNDEENLEEESGKTILEEAEDAIRERMEKLQSRYTAGTCAEHPDLVCIRRETMGSGVWHFELTQARRRVWAIQNVSVWCTEEILNA